MVFKPPLSPSRSVAQILSVHISSLPHSAQDWYAGGDAALICAIQTSTETTLTVQWSNANGIIPTNGTEIRDTGTIAASETVYLSILEYKSLQVHYDYYYCRAILGDSVRSDYIYIEVTTGKPIPQQSCRSYFNVIARASLIRCVSHPRYQSHTHCWPGAHTALCIHTAV